MHWTHVVHVARVPAMSTTLLPSPRISQRKKTPPRSNRDRRRGARKKLALTHVAQRQIKDASTIVPFSLSTSLFLELAAPVDASFHALQAISYVSHYTSFV